jgi:hydrogenase large subunit
MAKEFIDQVYIPDMLAIGSFYKDWLHGGGLSGKSMLSYGDIPDKRQRPQRAQPAAAARRHHQRRPVQDPRRGREGPRAGAGVRHPQLVQVRRRDQGPAPLGRCDRAQLQARRPQLQGHRNHIQQLDESAKYSWIKAPRWRGHAMEVGPLPRMVLGYLQPKQFPWIKEHHRRPC